MSDSLYLPTGLGRVGYELATGLARLGHEIGYIGWWHPAHVITPPPPVPIEFWPVDGKRGGEEVLDTILDRWQPDALLTIGDLWNLGYVAQPVRCQLRRYVQWIHYLSVDGEPVGGGLPPGCIPTLADVDWPVAYTQYAQRAMATSLGTDTEAMARVRVIYHGVNTEVFTPGDPGERARWRHQYGIDDKFLFLTVCRNQSRKNIPELFQAWKIFSELPEVRGRVVLWPHMVFTDPMGWAIDDLLDVLKLRNRSILYYEQVAHAPSELQLIPDAELARLYQLADAFVLLAGEGFGLPVFEAMATKVPCLLMDCAATGELGAEGRAALVPVTGGLTWTGRHLTQRPIPKVDDIVAAMLKIYRDQVYRESIAQAGYDFARQYPWSRVVGEWAALLRQIEVPFAQPFSLEVVT